MPWLGLGLARKQREDIIFEKPHPVAQGYKPSSYSGHSISCLLRGGLSFCVTNMCRNRQLSSAQLKNSCASTVSPEKRALALSKYAVFSTSLLKCINGVLPLLDQQCENLAPQYAVPSALRACILESPDQYYREIQIGLTGFLTVLPKLFRCHQMFRMKNLLSRFYGRCLLNKLKQVREHHNYTDFSFCSHCTSGMRGSQQEQMAGMRRSRNMWVKRVNT